MMRSDMPKENNTFIRASFTSESREYRAENFMSDCENIISHYFAFVKCCQEDIKYRFLQKAKKLILAVIADYMLQ